MRVAGVATIALALVLGACTVATEQPGGEAETTRQPPAGAIQVGDDYYMVPAGTDGDGCAQFAPWSGSNPVTAAFYYRKADGSFTLHKEQTDCARD